MNAAQLRRIFRQIGPSVFSSYARRAYTSQKMSLIDIGANLIDDMFLSGTYHGKRAHEPDMEAVLHRAEAAGLSRIIITAGDLNDSVAALALARRINASGNHTVRLHSTVGVHPTNTQQLQFLSVMSDSAANLNGTDHVHTSVNPPSSKTEYVAALDALIADGITDGTVVAVGECGFDFDRLNFASQDTQRAHFALHIELASKWGLPLFLHDRNCGTELLDALRGAAHRLPASPGVVHSFTGTFAHASAFIELGFDIGINGCSLKTPEGVSVASMLPLEHVHLETDAPWCEIRRTHASFPYVRTAFTAVAKERHKMDALVKGRCEPCMLVQVAEAVAGARGLPLEVVMEATSLNSRRVFLDLRSRS